MAEYVSKYVKTPPVAIDEDRFHYYLECLPPLKWTGVGGHFECFHVGEMLSNDLVSWIVRCGQGVNATYWEVWDSPRLPRDELYAMVLKARDAAKGADDAAQVS